MTPELLRIFYVNFLLLAVLSATVVVNAEEFTLTDNQGRTITADVLTVEGDKVDIKRSDGQTFTISLGTLSAKDQKALKAWAAANPPPVSANDLSLQFSRGKFDSEKTSQHGGAVTAYKDFWGYSITLANKSSRSLNDIRAEYILFVKKEGVPNALQRLKKTTSIGTLNAFSNTTFRTDPVPSYRYVLKPGFYWASTGNSKPIKDSLHGMWLRIYVGKQLVLEQITSDDIAKNEKW